MKKSIFTILMLIIASICMNASARQFEPVTVTNIAGEKVSLPLRTPCIITFYWDNCHWCHKAMNCIRDTEREVRDYLGEEMPLFDICWHSPNYFIACYDSEDEKQRIIQRFIDNRWETSKLYFINGCKALFNNLAQYDLHEVPVIMSIGSDSNIRQTIVGYKPTLGEKLYDIIFNISAAF